MYNLETILRHRFRFHRLLENRLVASDCEIECDINILNFDSMEEIHLRFSAIKLWMDDFIDGGLAFHKDSVLDTDWIDQLGNAPIMCPEEPLDHIIASLLHTKFNAIGGNVVEITRTHFICDTSRGFSNAISGKVCEWLPEMVDWMGERAMHVVPWWHRPDISTFDFIRNSEDDVDQQVVDFGGPLIEMIRADHEPDLRTPEAERKPAEIIKPVFRPRIVNTDDDTTT